ncbi:hypothetical protein JG687_00015463 [Phytophthora cactorum]|uniref:Uncharacterized protein n=1 Tax=Phytophthora cactorum TaxID=29920 RepID=A0A8T1TTB0_9STRA|nr:hypothetical protein JG687_00015463 [Phytophthora cactorum]
MEVAVTKQHAHPNTAYHCLYGYYNLDFSYKDFSTHLRQIEENHRKLDPYLREDWVTSASPNSSTQEIHRGPPTMAL